MMPKVRTPPARRRRPLSPAYPSDPCSPATTRSHLTVSTRSSTSPLVSADSLSPQQYLACTLKICLRRDLVRKRVPERCFDLARVGCHADAKERKWVR